VRGVPIALAVLLTTLHPVAAQEAASDDPAAVVARLFDAMRAKDTTALRGLFHADARLFTAGQDRTGAPVVQVARVDDFLRAITRTALYLDERIRAPEVRVDEGLATVWAGYDFYADSTFSHCGVDAFQLARTADGWKIIQVADTRRREGCATQPNE
jgi:hypothetical protein